MSTIDIVRPRPGKQNRPKSMINWLISILIYTIQRFLLLFWV